MRIGSLFSGAGGLDMAVEQMFAGCTVWHSEMDPAASKVLAHRWPGVPNLGDITLIDWSAVEAIDVLCGGFPCQDISSAGRQAGMGTGTRSGLWSEFVRAIAALRPRLVVIENVRNLLSVSANRDMEPATNALGDSHSQPVLRGLGAVLGDLSDLGYDAQWVTVSAASVGAPHLRNRVFILAVDTNAASDGRLRLDDSTVCEEARGGRVRLTSRSAWGSSESVELLPTPAASRSGNNQSPTPGAAVRPSLDSIADLLPTPSVADGDGGHLTRSGPRSNELLLPGVARAYGNGDLLPTPNASDGSGGGQHPDQRDGHSRQLIDYALLHGTSRWGKYEPTIRRWESLTRPAPSPTEPNTRGNVRLAAAFPEWMMGWLAGWVTDVPGIGRNDQLRIIGNGVVPQQALAALSQLLLIAESTLATTGVR